MMIGDIQIESDGNAITGISFGKKTYSANAEEKEISIIKEAKIQIEEYFRGNRKEFSLPLSPIGSKFQLKVWDALKEIPYGTTCSYQDIAIKIGNKNACRAVGMANHLNPIGIMIPCHRVIGKNKKLVGYAGGLDIKEKLLNLEKENS